MDEAAKKAFELRAGRLLSTLLLTEDDALAKFREQKMAKQTNVDVERVGRARDLPSR